MQEPPDDTSVLDAEAERAIPFGVPGATQFRTLARRASVSLDDPRTLVWDDERAGRRPTPKRGGSRGRSAGSGRGISLDGRAAWDYACAVAVPLVAWPSSAGTASK